MPEDTSKKIMPGSRMKQISDPIEDDTPSMTWFAVSLGLGAFANLLAFVSYEFFDQEVLGPRMVRSYGFLSTTYWSVGLCTTIPIALAAGMAAHRRITALRGEMRRLSRFGLALTYIVPLIAAMVRFAINEVPRHLHCTLPESKRLDYCQWSDLHRFCVAAPSVGRVLLFLLAYGLVIITYFLSIRAATFLGFTAFKLRGSSNEATGPVQDLAALLNGMRVVAGYFSTIVVAYAFHLALIRAAKVDMKLRAADDFRPPSAAPMTWIEQVTSQTYLRLMLPTFFLNIPLILLLAGVLIAARSRIRSLSQDGEPRGSWPMAVGDELAHGFPANARRLLVAAVFLMIFAPPTREAFCVEYSIVGLILWWLAAHDSRDYAGRPSARKRNGEGSTMIGSQEHPSVHSEPERSERSPVEIDFALVTAIEVERRAVCAAFGLSDKHRQRIGSRVYWRGQLPLNDGDFYELVLAQSADMANVDAALLTSDMLHHWKPSAALMVGIAATTDAKKAKLGDVVAGSDIYYFDRGKITPGGVKPEVKMIAAEATLWANVNSMPRWDGSLTVERPDGNDVKPELHFGVIASGEKVIADAAVRDQISSGQRKILAIEMEGYGFSRAVWQSFEQVRHLVLRGICDDGSPSKDDRWHTYAANSAAAVTKHFLLDRPLAPRNVQIK